MPNCTVQILPQGTDTDIVAVYSNGEHSLKLYNESRNGEFTFPYHLRQIGSGITFYAFPKSDKFTVTRHFVNLSDDSEFFTTVTLKNIRSIHLLTHILHTPEDINSVIKEIKGNCRRSQEIWDKNRFGVQIASHDIYIPIEPIEDTSDDEVIYGIELHKYASEAAERYPEYHHILYVRSLGGNTRHVGWCANGNGTKYIIMTEGGSGELLCHELGHMYNLAHLHNLGECGKDMLTDRRNVMSKGASSRDRLTYGQIIRAHFLKNSYLNRSAATAAEILLDTGNQGCADSNLPPIGLSRWPEHEDGPAEGLVMGNRNGTILMDLLSSDCKVEEASFDAFLGSILDKDTVSFLEKIASDDFSEDVIGRASSTAEPYRSISVPLRSREINIDPNWRETIINRARRALNHYKK